MTLLATTAIAQFAPRQVLVADRDNGSTHGLPLAQKPRRRRITILAVAALDAPYAACESHERCAHLADRGKSRTITSIKTGYCQPGWRSVRSWLAPRPPLSWPRCGFRRTRAAQGAPRRRRRHRSRIACRASRARSSRMAAAAPASCPISRARAARLAALTPRRPRAQVGQQARGR